MKHYPAAHFHPVIAGVTHSRPPQSRRRQVLLAALFYATGFFTGAILFGELLLSLHR